MKRLAIILLLIVATGGVWSAYDAFRIKHPVSGQEVIVPGQNGPNALLVSGWKTTPAGRQVLWCTLAATGSLLLLAVSNHITQNIAAVPLLWIVPLTIYLLTFILCFDSSGWYRREFNAIGVPFEQRGKIMDESLDILKRFWTEHMVSGKFSRYDIPAGVMYPKPLQKPRPPLLIGGYVDRVLKRAAVDGDGWLTYFYRPEGFATSWSKIRGFAQEAGKDPDTLLNANQLPIMIGKSRQAVESQMMEWLTKEWDFASWSESTKDSAIMGTVDECVEQLKAHLAVGTQKLIFVPYKYQMDQIETIAREIIPRLKAK